MYKILTFRAENMWEKAASIVYKRLKRKAEEEKSCLVLLSGGSVVNIYQRLAEYIKKSQIGSENLAVGQVDERLRPKKAEDVNARQIEKTGLIEVLKRKGIKFYEIPQKGSLERVTDEYDRTMEELFRSYKYKMAISFR